MPITCVIATSLTVPLALFTVGMTLIERTVEARGLSAVNPGHPGWRLVIAAGVALAGAALVILGAALSR